jgi:hypothetical protein
MGSCSEDESHPMRKVVPPPPELWHACDPPRHAYSKPIESGTGGGGKAYELGKQVLEEVATVVAPETILAWRRKLVGKKFDGSRQRPAPGRPKIDAVDS